MARKEVLCMKPKEIKEVLCMKPKEIYVYELTLREMREICIKIPVCSLCPIKQACTMLLKGEDAALPCEWETDILNTKVVVE